MNIDTFIYLDSIRNCVLNLPGVSEKLCFGTPAFYVKGKLFARLKEDGTTLVIHTLEREKWMRAKPKIFFITDHYKLANVIFYRIDYNTLSKFRNVEERITLPLPGNGEDKLTCFISYITIFSNLK